jgi:hypothetical protein
LHFGHVTGERFDLVMTWIPSLISLLLNFVVLGEGTIAYKSNLISVLFLLNQTKSRSV